MKNAPIICMLLCLSVLPGCGTLFSGKQKNFLENFQTAVLSHPDPATVKAALPAYLLLIDAIVRGDPDNAELLREAALLYSTYAGVFVDDPTRSSELSQLAFDYAQRSIALAQPAAYEWRTLPFAEFERQLEQMKKPDVPALYALSAAWAGWIRAQGEENLEGVADLARVEVLLNKIVRLDETYQDGGAHLYLGMLNSLFSPALGGKPELGKQHFEAALQISGGKNLMIKTLYAQLYARQIFDRALHDRLLHEVLAAPPGDERHRLMNALAKSEARKLLDSANDYF